MDIVTGATTTKNGFGVCVLFGMEYIFAPLLKRWEQSVLESCTCVNG
jgi:hypothetical protein